MHQTLSTSFVVRYAGALGAASTVPAPLYREAFRGRSAPTGGSSQPKGGDRRREKTRFWTVEGPPAVSLLKARYWGHRFSRHSHEEVEIGVNLSGAATITSEGLTRSLTPGSVAFINPGEGHTAERSGPEAWEYRAFLISPIALRPYAGEGNGASPLPRFRDLVLHDPELARDLLEIHRTLEVPRAASEALGRLRRRLADAFARHAERGGDDWLHDGPDRRVVRVVRDHLEQNFARPVPLGELADLAGLSRFHLLRVFRDETGLPPNAYQQVCRIRNAQQQLRRGVPIADVAIEVGFASVSHFTRQFKKIVGVPPGVWTRGVR
jgi:AraC-like DNA-binding protein